MTADVTSGTPKATANKKELPLPAWAETMKRRYLSGEATLFLLHGNVHDFVVSPDKPDRFCSLREFLQRFLGRTKEVVLFYNPSEGMRFADPESQERFIRSLNASRLLKRRAELEHPLPTNSRRALELMEEYMLLPDTRSAMILDFIETVAPEGNIGFMGSEDRGNLVTLQRWASEPALLRTDNLVVLVTENMADVHRRLVTNPQLAAIELSLPDEEERGQFLEYLSKKYQQPLQKSLAALTAGLSRIQMEGIFRQAWESKHEVTQDLVRDRKKAIIEQECYGLVEFIEPTHDFSRVGGMEGVKNVLMRAVDALHKGQSRRVPMGILFVGPMGTGKTFLAEAFAKESRLTCLKLKNFRDKWVGSTEANLEKIISVVKAMGYVLVIIDEGDRSIGGDAGDNDGGTSSRVIARLKEFMSDTAHRGRIIFVMMTNRPDKLDADMKRSGRFDLKIPFFFPQNAEEREGIFRALLKKNQVSHQISDFTTAVAMTDGYSGAEIEAIILIALGFALDDGREEVTDLDLEGAVKDFIPSRDTSMIEYMELLAVFECSSRRLLPERYQQLDPESLNAKLREMRAHLR